MLLKNITPLILSYNEAPNIHRTLECLKWATQIVVIDSFSTDDTLAILSTYSQVTVLQRHFDSFAAQCNYGLAQISTEWVLSLDADYVLTPELITEIQVLPDQSDLNGYSAKFQYCVHGKPLRGTLLPPRQILYRRQQAIYRDDGHAHRVFIEGKVGTLFGYVHHDDRKPLNRWLWAQDRYMIIEAQKLSETPSAELSFSDRIRRKKLLAPFIILLYCLILKRGIFDGWAGWYYAFQRMMAEILLSIRLMEYEKSKPLDSIAIQTSVKYRGGKGSHLQNRTVTPTPHPSTE